MSSTAERGEAAQFTLDMASYRTVPTFVVSEVFCAESEHASMSGSKREMQQHLRDFWQRHNDDNISHGLVLRELWPDLKRKTHSFNHAEEEAGQTDRP